MPVTPLDTKPLPELRPSAVLRRDPRAALTVDRYDEDWTRLAWVQIVGETRILDLPGHEDALDALAARYPQYRERAPGGPLLCLTPDRIVHWRAAERR